MISLHGIDEVLEATVQGNRARFDNHHCSPNAKYYTVLLPNSRISAVFVFAISELAPGDEVYVY